MNHACKTRAGWALALALAWLPVGAASGAPSVQVQLKAMQQALEAQQAQLEAQQQEIEAQRAEINALLRQQATSTGAEPGPAIEPQQKAVQNPQQAAAQAKLSSQEQPKATFMAKRPTVTSADGHSSISLRALVQMDAAHYDQGAAGTLATDFRRGSVGVVPNRETDAARDLSDGAFFRRAGIGVEGPDWWRPAGISTCTWAQTPPT